MNKTFAILAALLSASALSGCVQLNAEVPSVCKAQQVDFPGSGVPLNVSVTEEQTFDFPLGIDPADITQILLQGGNLTANVAQGTTNLDFLDRISLVLKSPPGKNLPELALLDYTRGSDTNVQTIALPVSDKNLVDYFDVNNGAKVGVRAVGKLPQNAWSLKTNACLEGMVDRKYPR